MLKIAGVLPLQGWELGILSTHLSVYAVDASDRFLSQHPFALL